jgi:hypothetical protein
MKIDGAMEQSHPGNNAQKAERGGISDLLTLPVLIIFYFL